MFWDVSSFHRLKMLKDVPYSTEEAETAAGMGSYTLTRFSKVSSEQDTEMDVTEKAETSKTWLSVKSFYKKWFCY